MKFDTIKDLFDAVDSGEIVLLECIDTDDITEKLQSYLEQRWKNGIFSGRLLSLKK